jgi:hypothetical protein
MPNNPRKRPASEELALLVVEHYPQARITYHLVRQLEPYLPIASFEKLAEELSEVVVDNHRLPLKMFAPHISDALFPIESIEDLVQKLGGGVRHAIAVAQSPSFRIRNDSLAEIFATALQGDPESRPGIPVGYISSSAPASGLTLGKGGE